VVALVSRLRDMLAEAELEAMQRQEREHPAGRTVSRERLARERAERGAAVVVSYLRDLAAITPPGTGDFHAGVMHLAGVIELNRGGGEGADVAEGPEQAAG